MKRVRLLGMTATALVAITGILSASAAAESLPNILPAGTAANPVTATTSSGESTFGNGLLKVKSSSSVGTQTGNATKLGSFINTFLGVKDELARTCTGSGQATGTVGVTGTFHIRNYKEGTRTLNTAAVLLLNEVVFSCGTLTINVKGCLAGALSPESRLTTSLTLTFAKNGNLNDNLIITVLNEGGTAEEACQLLAKFDTGSFELTAQVQTATLTTFKQGGVAVEVLVMPL